MTGRSLLMCLSKNSPNGTAGGRLVEKLNLILVRNILKKLFGGFQRTTGDEDGNELRNDVYFVRVA
jgi:hypothetical protein